MNTSGKCLTEEKETTADGQIITHESHTTIKVMLTIQFWTAVMLKVILKRPEQFINLRIVCEKYPHYKQNLYHAEVQCECKSSSRN